ncbi:MAG: hypothetical protein K2P17_02650 [Helicobacteraceae bacterium]|nr:hypothetical protein [Helicobacteraceae bacterium]
MKEDLDIYKWNISKDNGLEVDINNASDIIMKHYYRCECRDSFNVPDSLHQAVMEGKNYVCKNCKQRIVFVMDSSY